MTTSPPAKTHPKMRSLVPMARCELPGGISPTAWDRPEHRDCRSNHTPEPHAALTDHTRVKRTSRSPEDESSKDKCRRLSRSFGPSVLGPCLAAWLAGNSERRDGAATSKHVRLPDVPFSASPPEWPTSRPSSVDESVSQCIRCQIPATLSFLGFHSPLRPACYRSAPVFPTGGPR